MEELQKRLEAVAWKKSKPFCYGCYEEAPTGRCLTCGSDDLMRLLDGVGVEYGIDWVVKHLVHESVEAADTSAAFEESVRQCYPEETKIGWLTFDTALAIKDLDPVSWEMSEGEWIDQEVTEESLVTFDNGATYFWKHDLEQYVEESEGEIEAAG